MQKNSPAFTARVDLTSVSDTFPLALLTRCIPKRRTTWNGSWILRLRHGDPRPIALHIPPTNSLTLFLSGPIYVFVFLHCKLFLGLAFFYFGFSFPHQTACYWVAPAHLQLGPAVCYQEFCGATVGHSVVPPLGPRPPPPSDCALSRSGTRSPPAPYSHRSGTRYAAFGFGERSPPASAPPVSLSLGRSSRR